MRRIVIVGSTGSGKTTLAVRLAEILSLHKIDLDDLYWNPGWVPCDADTFRDRVWHALPEDGWVVTGNYSVIRDDLWRRADTLIWIDYSFAKTLRQLLNRTLGNIRSGRLVCNGNRETWRLQLSRKSILIWLLKTYRRNKILYGRAFDNRNNWLNITHFIHLLSPAETNGFLNDVLRTSYARAHGIV